MEYQCKYATDLTHVCPTAPRGLDLPGPLTPVVTQFLAKVFHLGGGDKRKEKRGSESKQVL